MDARIEANVAVRCHTCMTERTCRPGELRLLVIPGGSLLQSLCPQCREVSCFVLDADGRVEQVLILFGVRVIDCDPAPLTEADADEFAKADVDELWRQEAGWW